MFDYLASKKETIEVIVKIITLLVSALSFIWVLINGLKTLKNVAKDRKNKQITDYVAMFSDSNKIKKISGLSGLSKYIQDSYLWLFYMYSIEENYVVKDMIHDLLIDQAYIVRRQNIKMNSFAVKQILNFQLINKSLDEPLELKETVVNEKIFSLLKESNIEKRMELEISKHTINVIPSEFYNIDAYLILSSHILVKALPDTFFKKFHGNYIFKSSLYLFKCRFILFSYCIFIKDIARHMTLYFIKLCNCYLSDVDFYGSRFNRVHFLDSDLKAINFIDSHFRYVVFNNTEVNCKTDLSKTNYFKCNFSQTKIKSTNLNGSKMKSCHFTEVKIENCNMKGIKIFDSVFEDVSFFGDNIVADINGCKFINTVWYRAKLKSVCFCNCSFENKSFNGANLEKVKFRKCSFHNIDFSGSQPILIKFEDCQFFECDPRSFDDKFTIIVYDDNCFELQVNTNLLLNVPQN